MELSGWKAGVLLVNLGQDDWGHADFAAESGLLRVLVIADLGSNTGSELRASDECHYVGVVLENEDLLVEGSVIVGAGSDSNNGALSDMWELDLESKGVEYFS